MWHLINMPSLAQVCDSSLAFPSFWWPWQFWQALVRYFEGCPFTGVCLMFYSGLDWICGFGTGDQRGEVPFLSHFVSRVQNITVTCHYWRWHWSLAEVVFIEAFHGSATLFPTTLQTISSGRKSLWKAQSRGQEKSCSISVKVVITYINYLALFCMGRWSILPHLLIQPLITL